MAPGNRAAEARAAASPYRESADMPAPLVGPAPRGLVRAGGSQCRCRPPGHLWCWWFAVAPNDRWHCKHGGAWLRMSSWGTANLWNFWESRPVSPCMSDPGREEKKT